MKFIGGKVKVAKIPENEEERLLYLQSLGLLDTPEEEIYDDITKLAAKITNTPISLISLIDEKRQWFKSHHGLGARETDRELAFCAHAINEDKPFVIRDASKDERFSDNPLATGEPHVIFYAGIQLKLPTGHKLGTLCVIDNHPRDIAPEELELLQILADHVIRLFMLKGKLAFHKLVENAKNAWLAGLSHDLKNPAGAINGFANFNI
jgi:GAF domain-containing protein